MKNDVNVTNSLEGVDISILGEVKFQDVQEMTEACRNGTCGCSPDMLSKIDAIHTSGNDGNVTIKLSGKLKADEVKSYMSGCECGF